MISPRRFSSSLWRGTLLQLIGVIILPLVILVLIIAFVSTWLHQQAMRTMVGERDLTAVRTVADAIDNAIYHRLKHLQSLVVLTENDPVSRRIQDEIFNILLDDFDLGIAFFSAEGDLLSFSSSSRLTWESFQNTPEFPELFQSTDQPVGVLELEFDDKRALFLHARSENQSVIAMGGMLVDNLAKEINPGALPATQEGWVLIINADQQLVYQSVNSNQAEVFSPGLINESITPSTSGTFLFTDQEIEYVASYSPVVRTDWILVMAEPWEAVATPLLELTRIAPLVLVPILLISLVGLWFSSQQIVKPLRELEKKSDSLSEGNFNQINEPVGGIAEIRRLQKKLGQMAQKVHTAQQSIRDYIGAITEAQEEERRRLARELHDDTIQSLIALKQRVQIARIKVDDEYTQHSLGELEIIAEQTIEELRRIIQALRPIYLEDLGLSASLEMLTREMSDLSNLKISFIKAGAERRLSSQVELAFYRIAQEALSNIIRHAQASRATLQIRFDEIVSMTVSDNGTGFETPLVLADIASSGHFGLMGMYERADLIGAKLTINATPGKGTQLNISYSADHN